MSPCVQALNDFSLQRATNAVLLSASTTTIDKPWSWRGLAWENNQLVSSNAQGVLMLEASPRPSFSTSASASKKARSWPLVTPPQPEKVASVMFDTINSSCRNWNNAASFVRARTFGHLST